MSMISLKGIKSSYQRVKRLLSNPNDVPVEVEAVRKKPEIRHLGLQRKGSTPLPLHPAEEEQVGPDPFYDEINLSDQEGSGGEGCYTYSTLDRDEERGEEEGEYSYAILDRCYNSSHSRRAPRVKPRPKADVPASSQYETIERNNSYSAASYCDDEEEQSYSVLHRIPGTCESQDEEDSYSYGHYDDITEFQGRMFPEDTERSKNYANFSPGGNIGKPSPLKKVHREENRKSLHLELVAQIQDKSKSNPPKIAPFNQRYSSNLELLLNQRRPSQQEELAAAVKKRFSTHIEEEEVPIYTMANLPSQKRQVEKTYSNNLQLHSLMMGGSGCEKKSDEAGLENVGDFLKGEEEIEGLYDEEMKKEGGDVLMDGPDYAIPYVTRYVRYVLSSSSS